MILEFLLWHGKKLGFRTPQNLGISEEHQNSLSTQENRTPQRQRMGMGVKSEDLRLSVVYHTLKPIIYPDHFHIERMRPSVE
jgi:hypothetical protein